MPENVVGRTRLVTVGQFARAPKEPVPSTASERAFSALSIAIFRPRDELSGYADGLRPEPSVSTRISPPLANTDSATARIVNRRSIDAF